MKKYKIKYWSNGNVKVITINAESLAAAKLELYTRYSCDDIITAEEVTDNV